MQPIITAHIIRQQTDEATIAYYQEAMNRYDPDSEEYRRCQHIVAYFCEKVSAKQRSDKMNWEKHLINQYEEI